MFWAPTTPRPRLADFVTQVMASWRAEGGEPDVAPALIEALGREELRVRSIQPLGFATRPDEVTWQWPARFVGTGSLRLLELGRVSSGWVDEVPAELDAAQADPTSIMLTPMFTK
jgi:hypothetical protein